MRIRFLHDLNFFERGGGGEISSKKIFLEGALRGHDLSLVTPPGSRKLVEDADLVVLSNVTLFPMDLLYYIASSKPHLCYAHDYYHCRYRLFFPMAEKCLRCPGVAQWRWILKGSILNVFLSPLHRDAYLSVMPELRDHPTLLMPSPIDVERFRDLGLPREEKTVISINTLLPFKGKDNVLRYAEEHPELRFTFAGAYEGDVKLPPNCRYIGYVPHADLPRLYNQHEYLLHLPSTPQPFERTCAEAWLCGCRIIGNELVGALSYPWWTSREEVAKRVSQAPKLFWEAVDRALE